MEVDQTYSLMKKNMPMVNGKQPWLSMAYLGYPKITLMLFYNNKKVFEIIASMTLPLKL